jgi:hypothetical protein
MKNQIDQVLEERGNNYGDFNSQAFRSQKLKAIIRSHPKWNDLPEMHKESIEMILHKVSRIVNGNHEYADSWTDIAGYARLVERELLKD